MSYQQLLEELKTYEDEYREYRDLFLSDGEGIDPTEQAQLDLIENMIIQLRDSLNGQIASNGEGMCVGAPVPDLDPTRLTADNCRTDDPTQHPMTERDWTHCRTNFVQAVQLWCGSMQHVVNQFERDLGQTETDPSDIELAAAVLKVVVDDLLPKNVKLAMDVAEPILTRVTKSIESSRNGAVTLRSFCRTWDATFHSFQSAAREHDVMFSNFRANVEARCGNSLSLEAVSREISYLSDQLPTAESVRRTLLKAWIDSTEDEGPIWDEIGDVAGYFKVTIWRQSRDVWELKECYLDDTDEQTGVIDMLQREYPNTPLEDLPFLMRVYINHGLSLRELTFAEKAKSGGWSLKTGMQTVFDDWKRSGRANPKTSDLKKESLL